MKKTIYLLRGEASESYTGFKSRILQLCESVSRTKNIRKIKVVLTEEKPPAISIIPFKKKKIASISVVTEDGALLPSMVQREGFSGAYAVTEALPVAYKKHWDDGQVTPGVCLLTLFNQKPTIDYTTFIDRWHNSHTPLSLKLHPLWHYNRNVVNKSADNNKEDWDGIVEEHLRTRAELMNPLKFFGNPLQIIPNMIAVYSDTKSFLDYGSIEPYLAMEYHIKS